MSAEDDPVEVHRVIRQIRLKKVFTLTDFSPISTLRVKILKKNLLPGILKTFYLIYLL
jgi:hypothetical protein